MVSYLLQLDSLFEFWMVRNKMVVKLLTAAMSSLPQSHAAIHTCSCISHTEIEKKKHNDSTYTGKQRDNKGNISMVLFITRLHKCDNVFRHVIWIHAQPLFYINVLHA